MAATSNNIIESFNWPSVGSYNQLFKATAPSGFLDFKGRTYATLTPTTNNGEINIVTNFSWTKSKFREEVPRIKLKELKLTGIQQLKYYLYTLLTTAKATTPLYDVHDPYESLYSTEPTNFTYILPHYAETTASHSSSWTEKVPNDADYIGTAANVMGGLGALASIIPGTGQILSKLPTSIRAAFTAIGASGKKTPGLIKKIPDVAAKAAGAVTGSPYAGFEQPMYYSGATRREIEIAFPLFNIDSIEEIRRNIDFIRLFQYQNLPSRQTITNYSPPVIYKTEFAQGHSNFVGQTFFYVKSFTATNLGAVRSIDIKNGGPGVPVPEAFQIKIILAELFGTSQNIYSSAMSNTGTSLVNSINLAQNATSNSTNLPA